MKPYRIILPLLILPTIALADEPQVDENSFEYLTAAIGMVKSTYGEENFGPFSRILCEHAQKYITNNNMGNIYVSVPAKGRGNMSFNFSNLNCYSQSYDDVEIFYLTMLAAKEIGHWRTDGWTTPVIRNIESIAKRQCTLGMRGYISNTTPKIECDLPDDDRCLVFAETDTMSGYIVACCKVPVNDINLTRKDDKILINSDGLRFSVPYRGYVKDGTIDTATATLDMFDENCQPIDNGQFN